MNVQQADTTSNTDNGFFGWISRLVSYILSL